MMQKEEILKRKPCCACVHFKSCSVRTSPYIPCKDSSHQAFEYNPNWRDDGDINYEKY